MYSFDLERLVVSLYLAEIIRSQDSVIIEGMCCMIWPTTLSRNRGCRFKNLKMKETRGNEASQVWTERHRY